VANRGEIAARVVRTARAMDIATVAVFSDPDADAPFVAAADEAVRLPGATPAETYLRGEAVLAAAARTGADAVHPGYGFLSENAGFARDCAAAGVTFIGPPPEAIEAMGSKVRAKELMSRAGVPVLPGVTLDADPTPAELLAAAEHTGFPVLVKAAYGGGGRGMRVVHFAADLDDAVASAQREAASAFGDGLVFLERFVTDPRHVEVQILADGQGQVVHLFERDCSIQRRYQKIVEEAPSPAVDEALRAELGAAAVAAAKAIGYVGAGTVEFVLDGTGGSGSAGSASPPAGSGSAGSAGSASRGHFSFLEVNTRLQVEHPVTEMITGLDLVRAQLLVAEGRSLPPEVTAASVDGHAVEVRLYAEDPEADFRPDSGVLHRVRVPELPGVRVDSGVADGSVVGVHYDPLLAKVIAHAPSREEAARLLARALREAQLHGVRTNRDLLVGILTEAEFLSGRTDTGYLTRHPPAELVAAMRHPDADALHAAAAALAGAAVRRGAAPVLAGVPRAGATSRAPGRSSSTGSATRPSPSSTASPATASPWPSTATSSTASCAGAPTASSWTSRWAGCGAGAACTPSATRAGSTARSAPPPSSRSPASPTRARARRPAPCSPQCRARWCEWPSLPGRRSPPVPPSSSWRP